MNIEDVSLDLIDVGNRLRAVDPAHVLLIAASVAVNGFQTPIEVRPAKVKGRFALVAGAHRVAVARELEMATIPAIVSKLSDDEAELREIDENVYRHELSDLDRAVFLARKKAIHERLYPHTKDGGDRVSAERQEQIAIFGDLVERFTVEVRDQLGYSERTIQRIIRRASIAPDVRARLSSTSFARNGSELDALVKLGDAALQRAAVNMVFSGEADAPRTMAAAASTLSGKRGVVRSDADIQFAALMKDWKNAGAQARRRFIDDLVADGDPIIVALIDADAREAA